MTKSIEEKKENSVNEEIKAEVKKTVSELFIEELDEQEENIFLELKSILINKCELLEFEAVNEENLDDFTGLITYIKNGVVSIENDGILVNLRRPILNSKKEEITRSVTVLFERNQDRERIFTKHIKISKKSSVEDQKEFTRASLVASFKNIGDKMLSTENTRGIHTKDYMLLLTVYNFFRN